MVGDQRQIERACGDLRGKVRRRLANDRDLDQRMTAIEARQDVGQERFGVVVWNAEPSGAPQALARQRGERARFDLDDAAGEFDQLLALFRQPRAASLLDEQGAAQLLLQRRICIETADWVLCTRSAALVNEPESTMARNDRSWSVSSMELIRNFDRLLYKHSLDRSMGLTI